MSSSLPPPAPAAPRVGGDELQPSVATPPALTCPERADVTSAASRRASDIPWTAWLTHIYTAMGAALAFLSLAAVVSGDIRAAFLWLAVSIVVDSSDGLMARAFHVHDRLPDVDGAHLDDLVDYLTFVFVPAFLLYHTGRLPAGWGLVVAFAMLVASGIAFSKSDAKTPDHFFTGFPSYWNIVAFYLYGLGTTPETNAAVLIVLCVLVFVRIGYVYPSRTTTLCGVTVAFGCLWGALVLYLVWRLPVVDRSLLMLSLAFPAYYTVLSLILNARRK